MTNGASAAPRAHASEWDISLGDETLVDTAVIAADDYRSMASDWNVRAVREGIWKGLVSFPSQAPVFPRLQRAEIQWRVAVLYFVRRWGAVQIAKRYGITRQRVLQMLRQWTARAIVCGYVGRIPPEQVFVSEVSPNSL